MDFHLQIELLLKNDEGLWEPYSATIPAPDIDLTIIAQGRVAIETQVMFYIAQHLIANHLRQNYMLKQVVLTPPSSHNEGYENHSEA